MFGVNIFIMFVLIHMFACGIVDGAPIVFSVFELRLLPIISYWFDYLFGEWHAVAARCCCRRPADVAFGSLEH